MAMTQDVDDFLSMDDEDPTTSPAVAEAAQVALERAGDKRGQAIAKVRLAEALSLTGKAQEAMAQAQEALDICEDMRFEVGRGAALAAIARICAAHGAGEDDAELGFDSAQDALRHFRKIGVKRGEAIALWSSAQMECAFGTPRQAVRLASEAIVLFQDSGASSLEARACHSLADGYLAAGDTRRAAKAIERAMAVQAALGDKTKEAKCLHTLATIELQSNEPEKATELLGKARAGFKAIGDYRAEAMVMDTQRDMHLAAGRFVEAVQIVKETATHFHDAGDRGREARALLKLSELLLEGGDTEKSQKVAEVAANILVEARDEEGVKQAFELMGAVKHASMKREMEVVIELNSGFMHVPKHLIVDPGLNKRIQQSYGEALQKSLF